MSEDNVTPFRRQGSPSHQEMALAAHDQVILEGGEAEDLPAGTVRLPVRVTRLEMRSRPTRSVPMPHGRPLGLLRLREVPIAFYRFLFDGVGEGHHWQLDPHLSDEEIEANLTSTDCEVYVLYVGGAPAGFFELSVKDRPEAVVVNCFGLLPHARGRGFARWFLAEAISAAWAHEPARVRRQTNNYDSPIALRLYQQMGFEVTGTRDGYLVVRGE